jgi:hypothetical protein
MWNSESRQELRGGVGGCEVTNFSNELWKQPPIFSYWLTNFGGSIFFLTNITANVDSRFTNFGGFILLISGDSGDNGDSGDGGDSGDSGEWR